MIDTASIPHVCVVKDPPFDYGGRCFCQPRRTTEIVLDVAIARNLTLRGAVALLREIRGDNVVQIADRRRARRRSA